MKRTRLIALAFAFAVSGCGGSHGSSPVPAPLSPAGAGPTPAAGVSSFAYDRATLQKASYVGPAQFAAFGFDVMLKMQNQAGLIQYARAASDPSSPLYRKFLLPQELGTRFGASATDSANALSYFASYGIRVATWPQRMMVHVTGTQAQLEAAFHTKFGVYRMGKTTFIGPSVAPSVPANVAVLGSLNMVALPGRLHTFFVPGPVGSTTGFSPQQIATGFDFTGAYNAGFTGTGITIGVIGTGPISLQSATNLGDMNATRAYFNVRGSSTIELETVNDAQGGANSGSAGGFTTPPPVSYAGCGDPNPNSSITLPASESPYTSAAGLCNPEDTETQIDTEQTALLAPDSTVAYYLGYNPNDGCTPQVVAPQKCPATGSGAGIPLQGLAESDAEIQQAIADDIVDDLSLSFGESEAELLAAGQPYVDFETAQFAMLASEGIATFVSSGDAGANDCGADGPPSCANALAIDYPPSDVSVVGVGGVTAALDGAGRLAGPIAAWGVQTTGGSGGSGGGISQIFAVPSFQSGVSYYNPGGSAISLPMRGIPDLSLLADPNTGPGVITQAAASLGGYTVPIPEGGTSVAAPEMAAMWALVLQACKSTPSCATAGGAKPYRLGNPDKLLYTIYGGGTGAKYTSTFYDVGYGNNAQLCGGGDMSSPCPVATPALNPGYSAGPGYDLVTGIGVPFGRALIKSVVGI